jgi:DNA-binding FadR family transcriptional regulator
MAGVAPRSEKLGEAVARAIARDMQALAPGTMLPPESVMLDRYRLGRASLREGLRILEIHGLITIKSGPGGGPVVNRATSEDFGRMASLHYQSIGATFRDLVNARIVIEPMMAGIAAEQRNPELIARLQQIVSSSEAGDPVEYGHGVRDFHQVLAGTSDNPVLNLFGQSLRDVYNAKVSPALLAMETKTLVVRQHEQIVKAIAAGEAAKARRLTRAHMEELMVAVAQLYSGLLDEVVTWH